MTHEERLALAMEFNKKFIASNYVTKEGVKEIIEAGMLTQGELDSLINLYDEWKENVSYSVSQYVRYEGRLYKVIQAHTSQFDWAPSSTESLYTLVQPQGVIEEWGVRNLATTPFMMGEQVIYTGVVYESTIDNNVWSPLDYPQGWKIAE